MRITFKRLLLAGGLLFLLFVAYMAYQLLSPSPRIVVSPETTYITQPLADDGLPDFVAYVLQQAGQGVTPETNGAVPFLQAMWPADISPLGQGAVCKELGMDIPEQPGMPDPYNSDLRDALNQWMGAPDVSTDDDTSVELPLPDDLLSFAYDQPWTADQLPPLASWIDDHQREFDLLAEAARRPHYYLPSETLLTNPGGPFIEVMLPHLQTMRSAVRAMSMRGHLHLGNGDLVAAWDDCHTIYGLAATSEREFLVGELVSIACEGIGNHLALRILESDQLDPSLAREIHAFLAAQPLRKNVAPCIDSAERISFVTSVIEMSHQRPSASPSNSLNQYAALSYLAIDWNTMLKIGNEWYDETVAALQQLDYADRKAAVAALDAKLNKSTNITAGKVFGSALSRQSRSKNVANILATLMLPAVQAASQAEDRANNFRHLYAVAAALAVYRTEHGAYPDSLDALTPELFAQPREDVYGQPLVYHRTDDGYLLHSLGPNGVDDGGSHGMWQIYKGYSIASNQAEDRAIRELVGEPPVAGDDADWRGYQMLTPPKDADDQAIRLPLPRTAPPATAGESMN